MRLLLSGSVPAIFVWVLVVEMERRALHAPSIYPTTELHPEFISCAVLTNSHLNECEVAPEAGPIAVSGVGHLFISVVHIGHFNVFFGEMSVQVLVPSSLGR